MVISIILDFVGFLQGLSPRIPHGFACRFEGSVPTDSIGITFYCSEIAQDHRAKRSGERTVGCLLLPVGILQDPYSGGFMECNNMLRRL